MAQRSIFIVGELQLVRQGIASFLTQEFNILGESVFNEWCLDKIQKQQPQIILFDFLFPAHDIHEKIKRLAGVSTRSKLILLCDFIPQVYIPGIIAAGAAGILTKNMGLRDFTDAISPILAGISNFSPDLAGSGSIGIKDTVHHLDVGKLSSRELEILNCIAKGMSSRDTGAELNISVKTVEVHRHHILQKLKIRKTTVLINNLRYLIK